MRRLLVTIAFALVLPAAVRAEEPLENRVSKDYVILVAVHDAAAFKAALDRTALWATWTAPEVQQCLRPALRELASSFKDGLGLSSKELFATLPGPAVFAIAPPGRRPQVEPAPETQPAVQTRPADDDEEDFDEGRFLFLIRLGAAKATADRLLQHLRKEYGPEAVKKIRLADGTPCERFDRDLFIAVKDDLLGVANRAALLSQAFQGLAPADRLVETPAFQATMKPTGADAPDAAFAYLDIAGLFESLMADAGGDQTAHAILDGLGLLEMKGYGWSVRPVGRQIVERQYVYAPKWTKGLLKPFGQDARALLRCVPAEALGAAACRLDAHALFTTIVKAIPPFFLGEGLAELKNEYGIDLETDLLKPLGSELVVYILPPAPEAKTVLPRTVVEAPINDRERLTKTMDVLAAALAKELGGAVQYGREEKAGAVWYGMCPAAVPAVQVVLGVGEKRLVIATSRADAEAALERNGKPLAKSFLDRPEVAQALDRAGGDGALVGWWDTRPVLTAVYLSVMTLAGPALLRSGHEAERTQCLDHLHALDEAIRRYASAHDGRLPGSLADLAALDPPVDAGALKCPATGFAYVYVPHPGKKLADLRGDVLLVYELGQPHEDLRNVLLANGSTSSMSATVSEKVLADVPAEYRGKEPQGGPASGPAPALSIPGLGPLPSPEALFRHFTPSSMCVKIDRDGLTCVSESTLGPLQSPVLNMAIMPLLFFVSAHVPAGPPVEVAPPFRDF
jgi:hypothetical protein